MGSSLRMMRVIDSRTAGQRTRVIVEGGPDLGSSSLAERRDRLRSQFDRFRLAAVAEPRGSDALVGALLCKPSDSACTADVIFFDNGGYLDMSGHAIIGLAVTLLTRRLETDTGGLRARISIPVAGCTMSCTPARY